MTGFGVDEFIAETGVSRETAVRFDVWRAVLEKWSGRINLVGPKTLNDFWRRHALDSIQVMDAMPVDAVKVADLGSGAGFPGLAIAIAAAGKGLDLDVHLIEANNKKAAFLREAVRACGAPAVVRAERIEDVRGEAFDVVTARALAPLTQLFECAESLWKENTVGVFLKGRDVEVELADAAESWRFQFDLRPSRSDPDGRIVRIEGLARHDTDAEKAP